MKNVFFPYLFICVGLLFLNSCKKDDATFCTICVSEITPSFELCRESDGNAWVNGENTGVPYDLYLSELKKEGVECGD